MGARGPKSPSVGLTVIGGSGIEAIQRPEAPAELTDEMAHEWRAIVNRMPADWFPAETQPLLIQYCKHMIRARRLCQLINDMEGSPDFDAVEYRDLLQAERTQSVTMGTLATRMRLSQQSAFDAKKTRKAPFRSQSEDVPWR